MNLPWNLIVSLIATIPLTISVFLFVRQWQRERRVLRLAAELGLVILCLVFFIGGISTQLGTESPFVRIGLVILAIMALVIISFPFVLIISAIVTGITLIRHEGLKPRNLLSLSTGLLALFYPLAWGLFQPQTNNSTLLTIFGIAYTLFSTAVAFISILFLLYVVASWLNLIPLRRKHYDYIVVLGAGLSEGRKVTPLLAKRVETGIKAWHKNPDSTLIMSGGQGADELVPEAQAMSEYAIEQGIPKAALIEENRSVNTLQNIQFSFDIINAKGGTNPNVNPHVLIVSDDYHVFRALLLARNNGFMCDGRGSRTRLYFYINAMVREFVAFLVSQKAQLAKPLVIVLGLELFIFIVRLVS